MPQRTTAQWTWTITRIVLTLAAGGAAGAVGTHQYTERTVEAQVEAQVVTCEQELQRAAWTCVEALVQERCPQPVPAPDCIHNDVPCPPPISCYCCEHNEYGCNCKVITPTTGKEE